MGRNLDYLLQSLPLSSTEENPLNIPAEELAEGLDICSRSLVGKFRAQEEVIIQGLKSGMILAWESDFSIINLQKNLYQFIFVSEDRINQIIENGPWCFDGNLFVLRKWRNDWKSQKFFFDEAEFWVHIVELPLEYCIPSVGKRLISLFPGCKKAEIREEDVTGKRFFRLRIQVNILEPFRRVILLSSDNGKSCIRGLIQYERLPNLCYLCGLCDHTMDICNLSKEELSASETEELPFGPWLSADRQSSLLEELNLNELQQKVVEFGNEKRNESDFVVLQAAKMEFGNEKQNESDLVEGQATKNSAAANAKNQTAEKSQSVQFVWRINHFSKLNVLKVYSDVFVVGGYKWQISIYPKGNNAEYLPLYLEVSDSASLPIGWSQYAQFSLAVVAQSSKDTLKRETQHLFHENESRRGFKWFMPLSDLHDPAKGFIVNDTLFVQANVEVRKGHDSKKRKVIDSTK